LKRLLAAFCREKDVQLLAYYILRFLSGQVLKGAIESGNFK
jgi:hypothetical protein